MSGGCGAAAVCRLSPNRRMSLGPTSTTVARPTIAAATSNRDLEVTTLPCLKHARLCSLRRLRVKLDPGPAIPARCDMARENAAFWTS